MYDTRMLAFSNNFRIINVTVSLLAAARILAPNQDPVRDPGLDPDQADPEASQEADRRVVGRRMGTTREGRIGGRRRRT